MANDIKNSVFYFIYTSIKPFRWYLAGQIFVAIIWAIDVSLRPYLVKNILNRAAIIPREMAFSELGMLCIMYMVLGFLMVSLFRFHDWCWLKISAPLKKHVGMLAMNRMLSQSHHFYQNNFAGGLANRINDIISHVPTIVKISLDAFFSHGLSVLIAIYALASVAGYFALGLAVWVALFLLVSGSLSLKGARMADHAAQKKTLVIGSIVDILSNMMSVRLFGGQKAEYARLGDQMTEVVRADQRVKWFYLYIYIFQGFSFLVFQGLCFWWLIKGFAQGIILPGDFAFILGINLSVVNNLWYVSKDIKDFSEAYGSVSQGLRIMHEPIVLKDVENAPDLKVTDGTITFENVQFHYLNTVPFFQDKSITIPAGQKVGIVGPSGAGKSTFVNILLRLFEVNSGRILIDGQDISQVTQDSLRRSIAIIPQEAVLFHRSLMENIRYSRPESTDEEVIEAAKQAHAHDFIIRQAQGYNTLVGERGGKLSGGQRQRIAIARAFLKKEAKILVLDESTSQVDYITESGIQDSLQRLMAGKTTIVIAHRFSTVLHMDRILVFNKGNIVEDGTHDELLAQNGLYAELWSAQIDGMLPSSKVEE